MTEPHPDADVLLDLALGDLPEPDRGRLMRHVRTCERCGPEYADMAAGLDHVLVAAPRAEPSPGFDRAVLAAMGMAAPLAVPAVGHDGVAAPTAHGATAHTAHGATAPTVHGASAAPPHRRGSVGPGRHTTTSAPRDRRRRAVALTAAVAAAVGAFLGAIVTAGVLGHEPASEVSAVGTAVTTADGTRVGTVSTGYAEEGEVLVVEVAGRAGAVYACRLVHADGTSEVVGEWTLAEDAATWVVPAPAVAADRLELVGQSGGVWASAPL
ncbi:hypothetical protein FE374_02645 [Georgenia yuyongxinii]|uniref:Uncharacterized protein n=1 Tax=Georgenia yuyongxinii TaxID=2589797 RepID=A0A5B8BZI8_9MICO|nr:hypothetical protein [Georgenia yuyongxinii]QDC23673.1 hypothetical protein FE374_02645 [Georgenia yuyongxinii]